MNAVRRSTTLPRLACVADPCRECALRRPVRDTNAQGSETGAV